MLTTARERRVWNTPACRELLDNPSTICRTISFSRAPSCVMVAASVGGKVAAGFAARLLARSGAGFMNRRRLCQLTAAILTSDLTTHKATRRLSCNYTAPS